MCAMPVQIGWSDRIFPCAAAATMRDLVAATSMTEPIPSSHPFAGTVTLAEFARVQQRLLPAWARWYVLYPALAVVFLACTLPGAHKVSEVVIDVLFMAMFGAAMAFVTRRARVRAWRQVVRLGGRVHGTISPAGVEWITERTTARHEWAQIVRVDRTEGLVLAFFSSRGAFYFPRSFLDSDAAWTAFNDAIAGYAAK